MATEQPEHKHIYPEKNTECVRMPFFLILRDFLLEDDIFITLGENNGSKSLKLNIPELKV